MMLKENSQHSKRIRKLIGISFLSAVVLSVSTYAWFIGMQSVSVTSFDVEIEATDSLLLSFDGARWSPELTISDETLEEMSYANHTNNWSELIPMSTIGEMDVNESRMILYEKASFTATSGGYRLMASRVENYAYTEDPDGEGPLEVGDPRPEQDGYVVFDLFVRNFSGRQYLETLNQKDEEAIYLTTDSKVEVAALGVEDTGLENSVRVAFAQIGRVVGTETDASKITGITCNSDNDEDDPQPIASAVNGVTGICRTARIWEPNDTEHVDAAISWYNTSCRARKAKASGGDDITVSTAYSGNCAAIADGNPYPTYAVNSEIGSDDHVDVYDGAEYNSYTSSAKLTKMEKGETTENGYLGYFTDTMKMETSVDRPVFMYLAPNSVTKLRVYIFIEGQDIDNYDFSSIGKRISISFGFTKERYTEGDIGYTEPPIDTTRPIITISGDNPLTISVGTPYEEPENGYSATDNVDGDITNKVIVNSSNVNTTQAGEYWVTYDVEDSSGNHAAQKYRKVIVE